jgi:hypothetical protein
MKHVTVKFTKPERDIILAALRFWQRAYAWGSPEDEIPTNGGEHELVDDDEIDELCERINTVDAEE